MTDQSHAATRRIWRVEFPETGETWECRSLRKILWTLYEPRWLARLRFAVEDVWVGWRYGD